jgi:hypothetical protein
MRRMGDGGDADGMGDEIRLTEETDGRGGAEGEGEGESQLWDFRGGGQVPVTAILRLRRLRSDAKPPESRVCGR